MDKDPVCGMAVSRKDVAGHSTYQGRTFNFCSPACKEAFDAEPERCVLKRMTDDSHAQE